MPPRLRSLLAQIGSFVLAGVLLYLALRGVDLGDVLEALRSANYSWLIPLIGIVLLSHWLRAWRWRVLIEALPEVRGESSRRAPTTRLAFSSVMIGYMVNYAAPRLGEVARTANLSAQSGLGFGSLFGTVIVERILDVFVLLLALVSVFALLADRQSTMAELFIAPVVVEVGRVPALGIGLAIAGVGLLVFLLYRRMLRDDASSERSFWSDRAVPLLVSFRHGLATIVRSRERSALVLTTASMWFLYLLMAYVPFVMLDMAATYDLSLLDAWSVMVLGAIGVAIPSPGGVGSYHYITIQTLVHLFAVSAESAATYAVLTHAAQLILYVATGAICLILQGSGGGALRRHARTARNDKTA
jgi:hypothetical protein